MANNLAGKKLPLIIIGAVALAAGIFMSNQFYATDPASEASAEAQAATERLTNLQESLKTSLALPLDFKTVAPFELQDVNGAPITEAILDNQWSIMFFGFTHCPDVCPVTLQILKNVVGKLEEQGKQAPQIIFVTVDPKRDTYEVMKRYIAYFDERFVGITGEMNKLYDMTGQLGIVASFTANEDDPENYNVDHTASLLLIDPEHRMRAKISPPLDADEIVSDYLTIVEQPDGTT